MTKKITFRDIAIETLRKTQKPLTPEEIWKQANELHLLGGFETTGKTPWQSISALCYKDIVQNGDNSVFIQFSKRPVRFFLRALKHLIDGKSRESQQLDAKGLQKIAKHPFNERDLHPLLVNFAFAYFKIHVKTIFHEKSQKNKKGANEWLHPDLVGVYLPFRGYSNMTLQFQKCLSVSSVKLFSFEMKIDLDFANLRECYFQAVSNSSWANEGYLVALNITADESFQEELRRLNNSFGIGVIQLDPENIDESNILFPSRINPEIDWDTVDRLVEVNPNFVGFLKSIEDDCYAGKVKNPKDYDEIFQDEKIKEYVVQKKIKNR